MYGVGDKRDLTSRGNTRLYLKTLENRKGFVNKSAFANGDFFMGWCSIDSLFK